MAVEVNERDLVRVTGLWKRHGRNGKEYLAGTLTKTLTLYIYPAFQKGKDKPDWVAYLGKPAAGVLPAEEEERAEFGFGEN
jgi:hypothetical protein